jgi:hypothetical protein
VSGHPALVALGAVAGLYVVLGGALVGAMLAAVL